MDYIENTVEPTKTTKEIIRKILDDNRLEIAKLFPEEIWKDIELYLEKKIKKSKATKKGENWARDIILDRMWEAVSTIYHKKGKDFDKIEMGSIRTKLRYIINPNKHTKKPKKRRSKK